MKKKIFIIPKVILAVLLLINSCNKDELTKDKSSLNKEPITLKNGALNFESADIFYKTSKKLGTMSQEERDNWEKNIGFISMRRELNNIFDEIAECEDDCDINNIVTQNSDLIQVQDSEFVPIIESQAYAAICNRDGIFYVDGVIHKVVGDRIAIAEDGKLETVENALTNNLKKIPTKVNVYKYISSSNTRNECGSSVRTYLEKNNRECKFEMKTYIYPCGCCGNTYKTVYVESRIKNYKYTWGKWRRYCTKCEMRNRSFTISAPVVTGYNGIHSIFHYSDITVTINNPYSSGSHTTFARWNTVGNTVQNHEIKNPTFIRVRGEASNLGITYKYWAKINCGNWE